MSESKLPTSSQIEELRLAASKMTSLQRRSCGWQKNTVTAAHVWLKRYLVGAEKAYRPDLGKNALRG